LPQRRGPGKDRAGFPGSPAGGRHRTCGVTRVDTVAYLRQSVDALA